MRRIERTTAFRRDFKREKKGPYRSDLDSLVSKLLSLLSTKPVTFQLLKRLTTDAPLFHNLGAADRGTSRFSIGLRCRVGQPVAGCLFSQPTNQCPHKGSQDGGSSLYLQT